MRELKAKEGGRKERKRRREGRRELGQRKMSERPDAMNLGSVSQKLLFLVCVSSPRVGALGTLLRSRSHFSPSPPPPAVSLSIPPFPLEGKENKLRKSFYV